VPISLSPAARTERVSFHQLHKVCHTRLKQPLFCPHCNRIVDRSEVEKGYEYEKDQYIHFKPEEIKQIEPESAEAMQILEFVKLEEVDPIYFDASYYASPQEAGGHAYHLLVDAMKESGYAGVANVTMHNREYVVIIRARNNGLVLHTMFYPNEIRAAKDLGNRDKTEVKEQERTLALQLIENLAAPFKPEKYHDTYQEALANLIEAKTKGKAVTTSPHRKMAPVIDLMSALKQSIKQPAARRGAKTLIHAVPKREESRKRTRKAS
jgi:DNA end-binding protein Ku